MLVYFYYVRDTLRTDGAPGRTRTDTGRILSPLSLSTDGPSPQHRYTNLGLFLILLSSLLYENQTVSSGATLLNY